jgi:hypothetical protein
VIIFDVKQHRDGMSGHGTGIYAIGNVDQRLKEMGAKTGTTMGNQPSVQINGRTYDNPTEYNCMTLDEFFTASEQPVEE